MTTRPAAIRRSRSLLAAFMLSWRAAPLGNSVMAVVLLITGAVPALTAWLGKLLIDELAKGSAANLARAAWLAVAGASAVALMSVLGHAVAVAGAAVQRSIALTVEQRLYTRINGFSGLGAFEDPAFQDRLNLAQQAAQSAPASVVTFVWDCVRVAVAAVTFVGLLLTFWPPAALLLVVAAIPNVLAQLAHARHYADTAEATAPRQRRHSFLQYLLTNPRSAKEVRLYGLAPTLLKRMIDIRRGTSGAALGLERRNALVQTLLAVLGAVVASVVAVVIVGAVVAGRLSLGDMTLFTAAVVGLQSTLAGVADQVGALNGALRLFGHYLAVIEAPPDLVDGGRAVPALRQGIEFRDVWFRYGDGPWVLRGVDLTLPAGSTVGLVGANGAGKSTIIKLLCRFYDPQRGEIRWDGRDTREFSIEALRSRIAATFQDYVVYEASAAENIGVGDIARLGDRGPIVRAARLVELHDTITNLPKGYDTLLSNMFLDEDDGAQGVMLSGGQSQRLAVARSLVRPSADLVILDEPTSGLDADAEQRIHRTLMMREASGVRLLVSHRLSAIRDASKIVVIAGGRVDEVGDHDGLMAAEGTYARLFSVQAASYQDARVRLQG